MMLFETSTQVEAAKARLAAVQHVSDLPAAKARLSLLEAEASQGDFWNDQNRAQALMTQIDNLK